MLVTPVLGGRNRKIPGVLWPASLAYWSNLKESKRHSWDWYPRMPSGVHTHTHTTKKEQVPSLKTSEKNYIGGQHCPDLALVKSRQRYFCRRVWQAMVAVLLSQLLISNVLCTLPAFHAHSSEGLCRLECQGQVWMPTRPWVGSWGSGLISTIVLEQDSTCQGSCLPEESMICSRAKLGGWASFTGHCGLSRWPSVQVLGGST